MDGDPRILNVFAVTIQTLACMNGSREQLYRWSLREGADFDIPIPHPPQNQPPLQPWNEGNLWSYGVWTLAMGVIIRFLNQPLPLPETVFLNSMGEFFSMAEGETGC